MIVRLVDSSTCVRIPLKFEGLHYVYGLPRWLSGKKSSCQCRRCKRHRFDPQVGKIPWSRKWQPTPIFLCGKFHRQRRPMGYIQSMVTQRVRHEWAMEHYMYEKSSMALLQARPWCQMYLKLQILLLVTPLAFQGQSLHSGQGIPPDARHL